MLSMSKVLSSIPKYLLKKEGGKEGEAKDQAGERTSHTAGQCPQEGHLNSQ